MRFSGGADALRLTTDAAITYLTNETAFALVIMLASRARAIIQGRLAPSVDDVVALAGPILRHRMAVNFSARAEGVTVESVIAQMCARLA
jgi:MoxR-like ATPase